MNDANPESCPLATITVGNTHSSIAFWREDGGLIRVLGGIETRPRAAAEIAGRVLDAREIVLCSVVPKLTRALRRALPAHGVHVFRETLHPEIDVIPEPPENVGSDRVAAALGALSIDAKVPWVVVDAGTALTCNAVSPARGEKLPRFEGGLIIPGFEMSLKALNFNTAQIADFSENESDLDAVDMDAPGADGGNLSFIGRSTREAVVWGVTIAQLSAVMMMLKGQMEALGPGTRAILTGGGGAAIHEMLRTTPGPHRDILFDPALVHRGLMNAKLKIRNAK